MRAVSQTVSITYIAAGMPGGRLKAEARQISYRRSTCLYEVRVTDEGGQLVALATVNGFIRGKTKMCIRDRSWIYWFQLRNYFY